MKRARQFGATLAIGLAFSPSLTAQTLVAPPAPAPQPPTSGQTVQGDLGGLVDRFSNEVRKLIDDAAQAPREAGSGSNLAKDAQELGQAVVEYRALLGRTTDRFQLRQAFSGIDASWHYLQAHLARPGVATPALQQDAARLAELDNQIHQMLGMNTTPMGFYGSTPPSSAMAETQRLAHTLVDRAAALAAVIRVDLRGEAGLRAVQSATSLVQLTDDFHDVIDLNAPIVTARQGFAGVTGMSKMLGAELALASLTPRVQSAWRGYKAAEVLLRHNLGLPNDPADLAASAIPGNGETPIRALADELLREVDAFLQVFGPTAGTVPEGGLFLADAERLQAAAATFREISRRDVSANELALSFRPVDECWLRLARRTNRIARGRTGPNIQQVARMGQTCDRIHELLAMPGYPPMLGLQTTPP